jgi:hypothetical protein
LISGLVPQFRRTKSYGVRNVPCFSPCLSGIWRYIWRVLTDRYWIYKESFLRGPYRANELATMPDFSGTLLVCQDGDDHWFPVHTVRAFEPYISPFFAAAQNPEVTPDVSVARIISTGDYPQ